MVLGLALSKDLDTPTQGIQLHRLMLWNMNAMTEWWNDWETCMVSSSYDAFIKLTVCPGKPSFFSKTFNRTQDEA